MKPAIRPHLSKLIRHHKDRFLREYESVKIRAVREARAAGDTHKAEYLQHRMEMEFREQFYILDQQAEEFAYAHVHKMDLDGALWEYVGDVYWQINNLVSFYKPPKLYDDYAELPF